MSVEFVATNFKREGRYLSPNSYREIKLLEHDFMLYEKFWMDRGIS